MILQLPDLKLQFFNFASMKIFFFVDEDKTGTLNADNDIALVDEKKKNTTMIAEIKKFMEGNYRPLG